MRLSDENLRRAGYEVFGRDQYFINSCGHGQEFITVSDTAGMWRQIGAPKGAAGAASDRVASGV